MKYGVKKNGRVLAIYEREDLATAAAPGYGVTTADVVKLTDEEAAELLKTKAAAAAEKEKEKEPAK